LSGLALSGLALSGLALSGLALSGLALSEVEVSRKATQYLHCPFYIIPAEQYGVDEQRI
jgi:hypothetical protein